METIEQQLAKIGLEEKEIEIYLSLLKLGKSTIMGISRQSNIKRTTIYSYLEALLQKGLIFKTVDKKRVYYCPEKPQKLKNQIEKRQSELEERRKQLENLLPGLQSLYSGSFNRPKISFYEGREGLRDVYWRLFDTHKTIHSIFSPDNFFSLFSEHENNELMTRLYNNGGRLLSLVEKTTENEANLKKKGYDKFVSSKFLPENFKFETDLLVVGDTVGIISFRNMIGIIIEDQAIADLQKNFINVLWKNPQITPAKTKPITSAKAIA